MATSFGREPTLPHPDEEFQREMRVLILAPTRKDMEISHAILTKAGITCFACRDPIVLAHEIARGAGAVLVTEHLAAAHGVDAVVDALSTREPWSDLPIVMLLQNSSVSSRVRHLVSCLRNVTLLERPAMPAAVTSAVQAALRARERQYQIRHLLEREQAARKEGEHTNRMKDEFLATLSHELRTPLNAIFGWAQILKLNPSNVASVTEAAEVIDRNIRVQTQLIDDLLDMSRIISGKVRLDLQRIELSDVIDAAIATVLPAIYAKEIQLQKVINPSAGPISGDFNRLQQVLWNLLNNAVKFTPRGGSIHVLCEAVNSNIEVSVSDTGQGIDAAFLPHLFERFTQADGSITRRHGGLGLGLSIVKNLVELHGGTAHASSLGIGQGATFLIRLPLRAIARVDQPPDADPDISIPNCLADQGLLRGLKVLVVDDEPDARELVRRFVTEFHAVAIVADSSAAAENLVLTVSPDVIVSDIGMAGEDGYAFMRRIRMRGVKTPAIALTAFARSEDRIRALQAGYQSHIPKPVEPAELLATIARLTER